MQRMTWPEHARTNGRTDRKHIPRKAVTSNYWSCMYMNVMALAVEWVVTVRGWTWG